MTHRTYGQLDGVGKMSRGPLVIASKLFRPAKRQLHWPHKYNRQTNRTNL